MGRKRENNKHLPPKVHLKHGAYYYVSNNKWNFLGRTTPEMYLALAKFSESELNPSSDMNEVFDRYMREIAPKKSPSSFKSNCGEMKYLRAFFGRMRPNNITPVHIYSYQDMRAAKAPVSANREKSLLSHVFSMAIKWGLVKYNPCRDVRRLTETGRDRYVTDDEFSAVCSIAPERIKVILDFAHLTGLRRKDILQIKLSDLSEDGIYSEITKTKKRKKRGVIIEWTDAVRRVVERANAIRGDVNSLYLFNNKRGTCYTPDGFSTVWQRLREKALKEGLIQESFLFRDLRSKAGTDANKAGGREFARQLLDHTDQRMTDQYIRGVRTIKPLR